MSRGGISSREAANILRGPVDAANFNIYVFQLLFSQRLSDVHDEEYGAAKQPLPDSRRLPLDRRAFHSPNIGRAVQKTIQGAKQ